MSRANSNTVRKSISGLTSIVVRFWRNPSSICAWVSTQGIIMPFTGDLTSSWISVPFSQTNTYFPAKFATRSRFERVRTSLKEIIGYVPEGPKYGFMIHDPVKYTQVYFPQDALYKASGRVSIAVFFFHEPYLVWIISSIIFLRSTVATVVIIHQFASL